MKVFKRAALAFLFSLLLVMVLPSFSLSAYNWENCNATISCQTRGSAQGLSTTYQCHRSAVDGLWKWETQTVVSAEVESNRLVSGICSDTYDNNCNGAIDSADLNDCAPPISSIVSVEGDTTALYFDTTNSGDTKVRVSVFDESGTNLVSCKWYVLQSGYDPATGSSCSSIDPSTRECSLSHGSTEGPHTGYVACVDTNLNGQPYTDGVAAISSKKIDWIGDWSGPAITFDTTKPTNPTGVPYNIEFTVSDLYSGVSTPGGITLEIKKDAGSYYSLSFTLLTGCETAGTTCSITKTINAGDAEAAAGTYTIRVTATDNAGNVNIQTRSYTVSTCNLDSVTIAPSALCNKDINMCTSAGTACNGGNAIDVTAKYTGLDCPTSFTVQVDANTSDSLCNVKGSGGQMTGISITCSNPTPSAAQQTCTGTWALPNPIPPACQQKIITAKSGPNDACINGNWCTTPSGSFGACKDITVPAVSITLNSGNDFTASRTVTATSLSGKDNTYGLNSCIVDWGDASTTTKTCTGSLGEECANHFNATDKQHTYSSDGSKTATFSCTNKNSITGSSPDSLTICTSIDSVTNLKAWDSSSKAIELPNGAWQNDNTPYFEWSAVTSLCGVKYDVQIDLNPATTITTNSYTPASLSNGKHAIKVTSKDGNDLGLTGTMQTFNLWVDSSAPTTWITEQPIPEWYTIAPTLHLSCADNPVAPAESSGCGTTQYCTGSGCTPATNYNPVTGIPILSSAVLGYRSTDIANNLAGTTYTTINVDTTLPSVVAVTDDGAFTKSTSQLAASWTTSADPESGIAEYQYSVGTTIGGTEIRGYTGVGLVTTTTITGLSLVEGTTYYINVRAKNGAGLFSAAGSSNGIKVDTSGPVGVNALTIERSFDKYISSTFAVFTTSLADAGIGVDTSSCSYTVDGAIWSAAAWNSTDSSCKKADLTCTDGQSFTIKMRVSDLLGTTSETSPALSKVCDAISPELQSFIPATGTILSTSLKDLTFSATAKDLKSGLAVLEWNLFLNGASKGIVQKPCDGGEGVSVTCIFKSSDFVTPASLKNGDRLFVRVRGDDHVDPWSPTGDSGQWLIDDTAPAISTITPVVATLAVQQDYSASVKAVTGKTISSCDLLVNGGKVDGMDLTAGTIADGTWTGQYKISAPSTVFMRAHCVDNEGVAGDGVDVQISLATITTSAVVPSTVDKLQITNITANYKLAGGDIITGAKCWISSSDFNDPSRGIVGASLTDLNNGYYTYSFAAPAITGNYNYVVSCAKIGYQTTTNSAAFTVKGCDGPVCIKVTPSKTVAILRLGETQTLNLVLKNRDDSARTYSISLLSANPKVFVDISPVQVTLNNGEEKTVGVRLTSLVISDQQITQNIIIRNIDPLKSSDAVTSEINISIAVAAVPGIGAVEVAAIFVLAAIIVYTKAERKVKRKRNK